MSNHRSDGSRPSAAEAALDHAWRKASTEHPPADLDGAIVAAARKSVADRAAQSIPVAARVKSPTWSTRWQPLAAAAGVAGLAFVVVQLLPREPIPAPSTPRSDASPAQPAFVEPQAPAQSALQSQPQPQLQPQRQDRASAQRNAVPAPPVMSAPAAAAKSEANASEATVSAATARDAAASNSSASVGNVAPAVGIPPSANVAPALGTAPAGALPSSRCRAGALPRSAPIDARQSLR
jgi:hypothetical protein